MPTYEYRCRDCGHTFDIVQKMTDDSLTVCPVCGGELRKVFAPPAISFKGSGFYATDHGKKKEKSSSDGKSADGAEGTGDSKKQDSKKQDSKKKESTTGGAKTESSGSNTTTTKKEGPS